MQPSTVLIIADDAEFTRAVTARWQTERSLPALTLMSSDLWNGASAAGYELAIVGPVNPDRLLPILQVLDASGRPAVCVAQNAASLQPLRDSFPRVLLLRHYEGWLDALVLVCGEALRRVEAVARAVRAEQDAALHRKHATLGLYMLEMRHNLNNALTSVLGNSELLLLEPGTLSAPLREQVEIIHNMALRMHEILQRFSSLEMEMSFAQKHNEKQSSARAAAACS